MAIERFMERDKSLFARVIEAIARQDMARAKIFADELAEIRKMERTMIRSRIATETILSKAKTISEINDIITVSVPVVRVLRIIEFQVASIFPEAGREIRSARNSLISLTVDIAENLRAIIRFDTAEKEAQEIFAKVDEAVDKEMKEKLPGLPTVIRQSQECSTCCKG